MKSKGKIGFNIQTTLWLTLVVSLIGLSGCQTEDAEVPVEPGEEVETYSHVGLSAFDPPITVSMVRETSENLRDLEAQFPGEHLHDNRWLDLYRDVLGIDISYKWTADTPSYYQRKFAEISALNLPDVFKVDASQMRQLAGEGELYDLTDVFETYISPFTLSVLSEGGLSPFESAHIDQRLMGIPEIESPIDRIQLLWIRTDWLDKLDLSEPQTMDDVLTIAHAFTHRDPNETGTRDTTGLGVTNYLWNVMGGLQGFMAGFHAYPTIWIEDEAGEVSFGGIQPEVKDALALLREMYLDGQIDESFIFNDSNRLRDKITAGEVGMFYGEQWASFYIEESVLHNPDAEWSAFPIVSNDAREPHMPLERRVNNFWVVREGFEHPEALIKMVNLHLEKNWGETADYETYYSTPYPAWQFSPVTPYPVFKNLEAYRDIEEAIETGSEDALTGEPKAIYAKLLDYQAGDPTGWGWEKTYGESGAYKIMNDFVEREAIIYDLYDWPPTDSMLELETILTNRQLDAYQNIILGEPLSTFDQFVKEWHQLGGELLTNEVNEIYQSDKMD